MLLRSHSCSADLKAAVAVQLGPASIFGFDDAESMSCLGTEGDVVNLADAGTCRPV